MSDVDRLAQLIRDLDGNHDKGAGELAELLVDAGVGFVGENFEYAAGRCGFFGDRIVLAGLTAEEAQAERMKFGYAIFRRQKGNWERV